MDRWKQLTDIAVGQYGLVAVWQAAALGISRQVLAKRAKEHGWARVAYGIYQLPGHQYHRLAQLRAVQLQLRNEGAPAGAAALFVWGIADHLARPFPFLIRPDCSKRPNGARVRESAALLDRALQLRKSIYVPDPAWAVCSAAADQDVETLKRYINTGHRMRLLTPNTTARAVEELGAFKGRRRVEQAIREVRDEGIVHSKLERLGRDHLADADLHPHPHPHPVERDGRLIAEIDIAFIEEKVGIPIQGPHHLAEDQRRFDEDQRYELEDMGWRIIPADEKRLVEQAQLFIRQVRAALQRRDSVNII